MNWNSSHFETRAIHAGQDPEAQTGAVVVPIFQTSTFAQPAPGEHLGHEYSRTSNPTRDALQTCLAALEGGVQGLAFSSGLAATHAIVALLNAGDHVIAMDDMYGGTFRQFDKVWRRHGLQFSYGDLRDPAVFDALVTPQTKLLWLETPTNPMLKLVDIEELSRRAHQHGILVAVDNTFATPYLQQPLGLGADIAVHSTTKYIGGHSDTVGGAAIVKDADLGAKLAFVQNANGGTPGPLDSWLTLRGVKTLAIRMERHSQNARTIATWLEEHPRVQQVIYPGLHSFAQRDLAVRQMRSLNGQLLGGGMVTVILDGNLEHARKFLSTVRAFTLAESLGGVESLIEHPAIMTHASIPPERRAEIGISDTLCRLSVGIEHVDDLLADLDHALQVAFA